MAQPGRSTTMFLASAAPYVMRNTIKMRVTYIILIFLFFEHSYGQEMGVTNAEIKKFKIVKIVTETRVGEWKTESSAFYNQNGDQVLYISVDSLFRSIIYYEYRDSLLMKHIQVLYREGVLVDSSITKYNYKMDEKNRIIENSIIRPSGEMIINKIVYNFLGKSDTTYRYEAVDSSTERKLTECCKYIYSDDKTFCYQYDSLGWNSPNLKIVECYYSDTLMSFFTREYKVINSEIKELKKYYTKLYLIEGRQLKFESENTKSLVQHSYEKDEMGLITKHFTYSNNSGHKQTQVDVMKYYFRE